MATTASILAWRIPWTEDSSCGLTFPHFIDQIVPLPDSNSCIEIPTLVPQKKTTQVFTRVGKLGTHVRIKDFKIKKKKKKKIEVQ